MQALLMGGQACVFYGAAQFSRDVDLVLKASDDNFSQLLAAFAELNASRIAVPRFDPALLARGHAVHFRCRGGQANGLRVDVMTRLRGLPGFPTLWDRRTTIRDESSEPFDLLSLEDLVQAKKTQRDKDWPVINALVEGHFRMLGTAPTSARVAFWLMEARTADRLIELVKRFPAEAEAQSASRPLLRFAISGESDALREALDAEVRAEQARDRAYWAPLKAELEAFRRAEHDRT